MKTKFYLTIFLAILVLFTTTGLSCGLGISAPTSRDDLEPVTLEYWRVWEGPSDFKNLITAYNARRSHVRINIRQFSYEEFEEALVNAYAEDRAPDIISLHNTWLKKYKEKGLIAPMPETITMPEVTITGPSWHRQTRIEDKKRNTLSLKSLQEDFVGVVKNNVLFDNKIYGLPLAVDVLVLFYNRDILNNNSLAQPPQNWQEFSSQVKKIVKEDRQGDIILAGAALGRGDNILRSSDILSLLMMQNGSPMTDAQGRAIFHQGGEKESLSLAGDALRFYTEFSSPVKEVYTWNKSMPDSLEAFVTQKTAFFFGYPYQIKTIKEKGANLNFGLAPVPQTNSNQPVNFASYWLEAVSSKTKHPDEAWDFLLFASSQEGAKYFLDQTKKTTALLSLIKEQQEDLELGKIADQVLTAKNWYKGRNANAAELFIREMIDNVADGKMSIPEALNEAVQKINQTI